MKLTAVALLTVVLLAGCGSTGTEPYTGERNSTGQRHGHGTYTSANGLTYTGEWKNGERNGQGSATYADGRTYTGKWKNDKPVP